MYVCHLFLNDMYFKIYPKLLFKVTDFKNHKNYTNLDVTKIILYLWC